jgi:hypothetical protein
MTDQHKRQHLRSAILYFGLALASLVFVLAVSAKAQEGGDRRADDWIRKSIWKQKCGHHGCRSWRETVMVPRVYGYQHREEDERRSVCRDHK